MVVTLPKYTLPKPLLSVCPEMLPGMQRVAALAAVLLLPLVRCSSTICAADGESE